MLMILQRDLDEGEVSFDGQRPVDGGAAGAERVGDLLTVYSWLSYIWRVMRIWVSVSVARRSPARPRGAGGGQAFVGALHGEFTLELTMAPSMWKASRPVGVEVSMPRLSTSSSMLQDREISVSSGRCLRERAAGARWVMTKVSPARAYSIQGPVQFRAAAQFCRFRP
jgi:hypothetical protein